MSQNSLEMLKYAVLNPICHQKQINYVGLEINPNKINYLEGLWN